MVKEFPNICNTYIFRNDISNINSYIITLYVKIKSHLFLYNSKLLLLSQIYCMYCLLPEVFPCFFLSCKANARVKLAKTGHGPHSPTLVLICVVRLLLFVLIGCYLCCSMYCLCVNVYCHLVTTQLQLTLRRLMSYIYIYGAPILDVSRSHTTTQHSR